MKTGVKGKGHAYAAPSQTHTFSLRKTCQRKVFQKHLDASTWGKSPLAVGGHPEAAAPGSTVAPRYSRGAAPDGWVLPSRRGAGEPAAPSRCLRLQRRVELCQHRREGAEVPDTPRGLREQTASPPTWRTGPLSWQRKHQTWAGGAGGRGGSRRLAVAVLAAKLTSSYPWPESGPSPPARPRSSSSFRGSLFAGIFSPFPMLAR